MQRLLSDCPSSTGVYDASSPRKPAFLVAPRTSGSSGTPGIPVNKGFNDRLLAEMSWKCYRVTTLRLCAEKVVYSSQKTRRGHPRGPRDTKGTTTSLNICPSFGGGDDLFVSQDQRQSLRRESRREWTVKQPPHTASLHREVVP